MLAAPILSFAGQEEEEEINRIFKEFTTAGTFASMAEGSPLRVVQMAAGLYFVCLSQQSTVKADDSEYLKKTVQNSITKLQASCDPEAPKLIESLNDLLFLVQRIEQIHPSLTELERKGFEAFLNGWPTTESTKALVAAIASVQISLPMQLEEDKQKKILEGWSKIMSENSVAELGTDSFILQMIAAMRSSQGLPATSQ